MSRSLLFFLVASTLPIAQAQHAPGMAMGKANAVRSTTLTVTGLGGTRTLSPNAFRALPHITVQVGNAHNGKDERYSGVPVRDLLALVPPPAGSKNVSSNMQVVVAGATDYFHVALTLCDTNPDCRSGQAIVADTQNGATITADGASSSF